VKVAGAHGARQLAHLGDMRPPRLPTQADIAEARSKLARQGLYVEPMASVATAGLSTYLRQAEQAPLLVTREALHQETQIAVVALTGSGLKAA
jgi:threonine synthase